MAIHDDIDKVLQLAEDELEHLERESEYDKECGEDYICSKAAFERVRDYFVGSYLGTGSQLRITPLNKRKRTGEK